MKIVNIKSLVIVCCFLLVNCSKKANQAPSEVDLIFPSENLLCIDNTISFNWSEAIDPDDDDLEYNIIIAKDRALTNVVENRTITKSQVDITLEKETAYYWKVDALDINNNLGSSSQVFAFYTKGEADENYVPFTSQLISPNNNTYISSGTAELTWKSGDPNLEDVLSFEVYFGEDSDPVLVDDNVVTENYSVNVVSGTTYYWKVNVKDEDGAKSIGQIWSFSAN
ncbi:hypothetical protein BW723_09375 [Polaribacter reichenbachii]|uniref:Fibronectin type-III domain-containing protein n=1 Tax=Polaribacter reichenbachii TaxID=996801 RepID=A0A1B8U7D9_9FLAO|nr:hypothetical protein [Polaribacter reichenbachii]APZ46494.1 hypothetical protein BW723_09375 [Polaribacter reichenbachii]AUC20359.1 hypothetical protein BTO17_17410 [Polaribacter reichenbachii]OBY67739.1 hypothetical protein LPB301_00125 [Polaribacter reichenbachii]